MRRSKQLGKWVIAVAAGTLVLAAACTPSGDDDDEGSGGGELVWAIGGAEAQPAGVDQKIADLWNEQNPDNPITIEVLPDEADQQREQQVNVLQSGSDEFDVLGTDVIWTGEYSQNGWLESLEDVRDQIEPEVLEGAFNSAQWDGELWAAPFNTNAGFLYYRTDLVDQPPETWDELCQIAEQVGQQEDIGGLIGQGFKYEGFVVNWLEYYWSAGGELYNEDNSEVLFDTDLATQTTEFMQNAMDDGCFAPGFNTATEEEGRAAFQSGKAVFMRNWPYAYQLIQDEGVPQVAKNFDIAPLPTFTGEGTISALGGFNNAVSAYSSNKDAAKEFVVWAATDPEVQKMLATVASVPPVLTSVYDELQNEPDMALLSEVLPDAKPRPPAPTWNTISVEMQDALFPAYNGDADPAEASDTVADAFNESVEE
ncbi:MAG TPA: ABC transporter substrate-binding protein [Nocardioidaceae bacterium]|nr:ABC transporter substrate-binding protein [Nocardioidaceae bacterium]